MQYKGHELKEITEPQIFDPPKKMLVWDVDWCIEEQDVVAILPITSNKLGDTVVIRNVLGVLGMLKHCAEIPEEPKPRMATNRELAKWLAQGHGEMRYEQKPHVYYSSTCFDYDTDNENEPRFGIQVRKWDDTEWHEPTAEYLGLEEKRIKDLEATK